MIKIIHNGTCTCRDDTSGDTCTVHVHVYRSKLLISKLLNWATHNVQCTLSKEEYTYCLKKNTLTV